MLPIASDTPFTAPHIHAASLMMLEVARENGIVEAELNLIRAFHDGVEGLAPLSIDSHESFDATVFHDPAQCEMALALCLATAFADGTYSPEERTRIEGFAAQLGVTPEALARLEVDVRDSFIGQLSHLPDTEAVAALARQLA